MRAQLMLTQPNVGEMIRRDFLNVHRDRLGNHWVFLIYDGQ